MSFIYAKWMPLLIALLSVWVIFWLIDRRRFYLWLKDSFGLHSTFFNYLSKTCFVIAVIFCSTALLDLRGPEERIDTPLSDQKTVVLIDTSSSMLVEDVQPNRFKRAITVARHFVKNAVGHQISIILFSDISKRLVPFTDDIDLLDARLAGLEDERLRGGGSNISAAISETVETLKRETSNGKPGGNILLLTDAEENGQQFKVEAALGISFAVIGIGTVSGGKIPMRTQKGTFSGYKTHMNEEVVSKLDEAYLDRIAGLFERGRKWVVLSFSMPTEEVLTFFRNGATNTKTVDQNKVRPVRSQWLMAIGLLFYIVSVICGSFRGYRVISTLLIFALLGNINEVSGQEKSEIPLDILEQDWSGARKQDLAFRFAKEKEMEKAALLYEEAEKDLSPKARANWGASLLAQGKPEGLDILNEVLKENNGRDIELERAIHSNVKKYFVQQKKNGEGKGKDNKEKSDKDKKSSGGSGNGKGEKDKKNGDQSQSDSKDSDKESKSEDSKDGEGQEQQEPRKITNMAQREREIDKKRRMMKVPALLKQLMQDDRALQGEFIDTVTQDREQSRQKKDW